MKTVKTEIKTYSEPRKEYTTAPISLNKIFLLNNMHNQGVNLL